MASAYVTCRETYEDRPKTDERGVVRVLNRLGYSSSVVWDSGAKSEVLSEGSE